MLQEAKIFLFGHRMNLNEMKRGWQKFSQSDKVPAQFLEPSQAIAKSFSTDGKAAYNSAVGQRNMMAGRLAQLRRGRYKQNEPQPGDNPHNLTVGNITKLSANILGSDEEVRVLAEAYKLRYEPIRPPDGVPTNMTLLNTAIWAARSAAAAGGIIAAEQMASQFLPYVKDIAYVFPYAALATASIPLVFTFGNGLRSLYSFNKDRNVRVYRAQK